MTFIASRCVGTCGGNIDGVLIAGDFGLSLERGCSPGSRFVPGLGPRRKTVVGTDEHHPPSRCALAVGGLCACIQRISSRFRYRGTSLKALALLAVAQGAVVAAAPALGCMPFALAPWAPQYQVYHQESQLELERNLPRCERRRIFWKGCSKTRRMHHQF